MPDFGKLCQKVETIDVEVLISKIENMKLPYIVLWAVESTMKIMKGNRCREERSRRCWRG